MTTYIRFFLFCVLASLVPIESYAEAESESVSSSWQAQYRALHHQDPFQAIALLYSQAAQYEPNPDALDGEVYYRLMQLNFKVGDVGAAKEALKLFEAKEPALTQEAQIWLAFDWPAYMEGS